MGCVVPKRQLTTSFHTPYPAWEDRQVRPTCCLPFLYCVLLHPAGSDNIPSKPRFLHPMQNRPNGTSHPPATRLRAGLAQPRPHYLPLAAATDSPRQKQELTRRVEAEIRSRSLRPRRRCTERPRSTRTAAYASSRSTSLPPRPRCCPRPPAAIGSGEQVTRASLLSRRRCRRLRCSLALAPSGTGSASGRRGRCCRRIQRARWAIESWSWEHEGERRGTKRNKQHRIHDIKQVRWFSGP